MRDVLILRAGGDRDPEEQWRQDHVVLVLLRRFCKTGFVFYLLAGRRVRMKAVVHVLF